MANLITNIAKGRIASLAGLPAANDGLVMVPLKASGLGADDTLRDADTLSAVLAAATEHPMGRKVPTSVLVTVDDTNNRVDIDFDDITWAAVSGDGVGALVLAYDPDTTTGDDTTIVPIAKWDFAVTPNGTAITAEMAAGGVLRAS